MPYVPPHLRGGGGDAGSSSLNSGARSSSHGNLNSFDRDRDSSRGGGWGRDEPRTMTRTPSASNIDSRGSSSRRGGGGPPPEAVLGKWQPSERVQKLDEEQIADIRQRLNVDVEVPEGQPPAAAPIESFIDMNLHENIISDIKQHKYETPTPIQAQGVPVALSGRDILGCAETGSGKTASFAIPMIQHCLQQPRLRPGDGPMALVLAPTRELAQQIDKEVRAFALSSSRSVRSCIVVGGVGMQEQRRELLGGVEVVVATPGRFIDHLQQGNTNLGRVSYVVLDEADRMLDMGFEPQIREVLQSLPTPHQTLLFSATMPKEIEALSSQYLNQPVKVKIGRVSVPTANVAQSLERTTEAGKLELLAAMLQDDMERSTREGGPPMPLTIVFVERKNRCDEVAQALAVEGVPAVALHGGLSQYEREAALKDFSAGTVRVLIATDVASRGLDVKDVGHVINMDLPRAFEDTCTASVRAARQQCRTGRAGTRGRATSFFTDRDAFLVSQIKTALAELEKGNVAAFAMGKEARQAEKALAQKFKSNMKLSSEGLVPSGSGLAPAVKVDGKYAYMATAAATASSGAADAAWDD
ncbi:P-loop containing nucleoside triphosphate hydrolase protein [Scenedesmus sp. NREL 46B-D3]|nr:P-loop containing nucleoside triphosphate hydrolase protein [Scenedesmus sp. NREL 46B-D3]